MLGPTKLLEPIGNVTVTLCVSWVDALEHGLRTEYHKLVSNAFPRTSISQTPRLVRLE